MTDMYIEKIVRTKNNEEGRKEVLNKMQKLTNIKSKQEERNKYKMQAIESLACFQRSLEKYGLRL